MAVQDNPRYAAWSAALDRLHDANARYRSATDGSSNLAPSLVAAAARNLDQAKADYDAVSAELD